MYEKKSNIIKTPDLSKLKEVIIDHRTRIYIDTKADSEEARKKYLLKISSRKIK